MSACRPKQAENHNNNKPKYREYSGDDKQTNPFPSVTRLAATSKKGKKKRKSARGDLKWRLHHHHPACVCILVCVCLPNLFFFFLNR